VRESIRLAGVVAHAELAARSHGRDLAGCWRRAVETDPGNGLAGCRVVVKYSNSVGRADLALSEARRVRPEDALIDDLKQQARVRSTRFAYG
jgi:hypothetical protein